MNKTLIAQRFTKAIGTYTHEASVQKEIAHKMIHLLQTYLPTPCPEIIEFGCGTGTYSRLLLHTLQPQHLLLNDLCPQMQHTCRDLINHHPVTFLAGDAETLPFPPNTNLITSCSTLQWFEAPHTFFQRCHTLLHPQGHFAFSTFGKNNFQEIQHLTGRGLIYHSRQELETALAPHFDILHAEEEHITLTFTDPMKVLRHLKQTGVTGTTQHTWTRQELLHFCQRYTHTFGQGNTVSLTYHPIYIIAKKK